MTGIPDQAIAAAAEALGALHLSGAATHMEEARVALWAAAPFLAEDGWDAARDRATEANDARRDERERILRTLGEHKEILASPLEGDLMDAVRWRHVADLLRKATTGAA